MTTPKKRILLVAGARPNFMKIAPLWNVFRKHPLFEPRIVHTGQHYDYTMSQVFLDQLELPEPDFFLDVGSGTHAVQTASVLQRFEKLLMEHPADLTVVVGDVNSTLGAALAAVKLGVPVAHVEAGLRSFDRAMPEEINRVLTDRIADVLFATEQAALDNLQNEGVESRRVHLVGNLMIDSLARHLPAIQKTGLAVKMGLEPGRYAVATLHRPSNVDDPASLRRILEILCDVAARMPVVWPVHPRTSKSIEAFGLAAEFESVRDLTRVDALGYFEFVGLMRTAAFVLTDSGGVQSETTWLGVPCVTLRTNTEQPVTCREGTNSLVGLDRVRISEAIDRALLFDRTNYSPPALWDGEAAGRIAGILTDFFSE